MGRSNSGRERAPLMDRRTFLQSALVVPALMAARVQRAGRRVAVLGGGLAGLSAAYELHRAGCDVTILEARTRPGGRVYTLREPFSDALYADAGAARIQDSHAFTLRYVKEFGLTLDPFFPSDGARVTRVGDRRIVTPPATRIDLEQIPLAFSDEERKLGYGGCLNKYLFSHLTEVGDPTADGWLSQDLGRFELTLSDFCRRQGASAGMLVMIALGHDLGEMSALQFLRDAALSVATRVWYKIRGGNDLLPRAFASRLADRIHYGAEVLRVEQRNDSVHVIYRTAGGQLSTTADVAVCTIPPAIFRRVEMAPSLSSRKKGAIDELGSLPMARVFLQSRRRFWLDRNESGWGSSDDPIDVWDYTRDQPGQRGILGAYTSGRMARSITTLDPAARGPFVLEMMERLHPGIRENIEGSAAHSWIEDRWSLGAGAEFKPGQLSSMYGALRAPEGRLHFAGEHTSPWSGWMNGALESGNRVAKEILGHG